METTERGNTAELTNFHKSIFYPVLFAGLTCTIALAGLGFFLAGGIVVILTFVVEVGNIKIWKWRIKQVPIRALSDLVNEFKNRSETNEP
ncbi:MAG TPA: hypothetical protein ENH86_01075 [Candidatus Jorgensenbacteria bacterium]|uniref:Uncharacterized protein n=1 Tax=marine sediment metagenome TaxID=412755 RepID=A0A0F8W8K0_9ZZZZ|nr:hypothetical protein [Candidatus Jorgensenbacteria bacterium]